VNRQIHACYNDCNDYGGGGSGEGSGGVGVEVLRARLTRRDVEDLDLISEISPIKQALGSNRKIQLDIHPLPSLQPNTSTWRLLILDGHGSHTAIDFLWFCKQQQIYLSFLPGHASHVLQPLDLGVLAPLKSRYRSQIAALASLDDASPVKEQRFLTCYNLARRETFNPRLLLTGWKSAGLIPYNPQKGLN
jgi:hypothetical protein